MQIVDRQSPFFSLSLVGYDRFGYDRRLLIEPIEEIVSQLEKQHQLHPTHFIARCSVSGFVFDALRQLKPGLLRRLAALHNSGVIELVAAINYLPDLQYLRVDDLLEQIQCSVSSWNNFDVAGIKALSVGSIETLPEVAQVIEGFNFDYLICSATNTQCQEYANNCPVVSLKLAQRFLPLFILNRERAQSAEGVGLYPLTVLLEEQAASQSNQQPVDYCLLDTVNTPQEIARRFAKLAQRLAIGDLQLAATKTLLQQINPELLSVIDVEQILAARTEVKDLFSSLTRRANYLRQEFQRMPEIIAASKNFAANGEKLIVAKRYFQQSLYRPAETNCFNHFGYHRLERRLWEALLRAQVEVDSICHTDLDPQIGWIEHSIQNSEALHSSGKNFQVVDTPFVCYRFDCQLGAGLVELSYKPRKINLLTGIGDCSNLAGFNGQLLSEPEVFFSQPKIATAPAGIISPSRKGGDFITLCCRHPLLLADQNGDNDYVLVRNFTLRSSLGAHLIDATTGFTVEYWIEGRKEPEQDLVFSLDSWLMLPSANIEGFSSRALMCVGSVSEKVTPLNSIQVHQQFSVDGGIYGLRLIDGVEQTVVDLRSAKLLHSVASYPIVNSIVNAIIQPDSAESKTTARTDFRFDNGYFPQTGDIPAGPIGISLCSEANKIFGFDKRNTIFVSIA